MLSKLALIFSFIAGIFAFGYLETDSGILIFVFILLIIVPIIFKKYYFILMALIFAAGGFLQIGYQAVNSNRANAILQRSPDKLTGVITDDIARYDNSTYFYINSDNGIKIRVRLKGSHLLYPGNIVEITNPKIFAVNINNKISAANTKLLGRNTFLSSDCEEMRIIGFNRLYLLQYYGKILREKSGGLMKKHLDTKEAEICAAMFSGENFTMEADFYDKLITSGTLHIIVVSGSHFAMLYMILFVFLTFFIKNRRLKLFVILPFLIFFVFFTGSTISVIRSFIMSAVVLFADIFYIRRVNSRIAAAAIAAVFLALTPTLVYSPSFLLSFGAVLGMSLFQSDVSAKTSIKWRWLNNFTALFITSQIFTIPIIYFFFSRVSKVAFIANLLLETAVAAILAVTILFVTVASISYQLAAVVAFFLSWMLKYFILVVEWTAGLDIWGNSGSPYSIVTAMLIMAAFIVFFFFVNLKDKIVKLTALIFSCLLIISSIVSVFIPMTDKYYVTFLGSESTNSAVIRLKNQSVIFYGTVSDLYFHKSEITSGSEISLMIVTEAEDEAMLSELSEIFRIKNIVAPKKLEPKLHWLKNVTFMTEKRYTADIHGLKTTILSNGEYFREVSFTYENHTLSFAGDDSFSVGTNKTIILNPEITSEKTFDTFDKSIVLLSKKYYNNVKEYNNYSILEFSKNGIKLR